MPHVAIHLSGSPDAELARRAVAAVCDLTREVLHKEPPVTAVAVQFFPRETWFIGGKSLAELGRNAFHLDISITDETNTKAEKSQYIARTYAALSSILGNLHECSYIHVIDARGAAYGYGGKTQEYRYQHAGG